MKYYPIGPLVDIMFGKAVKKYTKNALSEIQWNTFHKEHMKQYKAMVERTPSIGNMKENMFAFVMYLACYGYSYYKASPTLITEEIFAGMIEAICNCDFMKRYYSGKDCFSLSNMEKYKNGSIRSKKKEYPMDWLFDFAYDCTVPEYYITHYECGVCKIGKQEKLQFLTPFMCVMDFPTIEYQGGKLIRTKTLSNGDDCCNFHVVKAEEKK